MLRVLRAVDAAFEPPRTAGVAPFSVALEAGERGGLTLPSAAAASIAARLAAGMVKITGGTLFIGDYDPRIQPVQAKRMVGFVPRDGRFGDAPREPILVPDLRAVVDFHAALYEVERDVARRAAAAVLDAFGGQSDLAVACALALIRPVALLVLDQVPAAAEEIVAGLAGERTAILTTRWAAVQPTAHRALAAAGR
jgi:ABC-type Na+ transport system ATPase subunit NatA